MTTEFHGGFEKLLNDNRRKWRFLKYGLMIMKFNGKVKKLLNNNGQK